MQNYTLNIHVEDVAFTSTSAISLRATTTLPQSQTITFSLVEINQQGTRELPGITLAIGAENGGVRRVRCISGGISPDAVALYAVFRAKDGGVAVWPLPATEQQFSPMPIILEMLQELPGDMLSIVHHLETGMGQSIQRIWGAGALSEKIIYDGAFGKQPTAPRYSVIIPFFGRYDFARHQLAALSQDPCFTTGRAEVILVLDKPEDLPSLSAVVGGLDTAFGVPFRLVVPTANLGYAGANNFGVDRARGAFVCLLNSDVIPVAPGWLDALADRFVQTSDAGAIGALLLYENENIQHAGMTFALLPGTPWYINDHPLKGLGLNFLPQRGLQHVAAVTGACMFVERSLYLEIGGLDTGFLRGDFEDSDFCLRLRRQGKSIYVDLDTTLYHLERQSITAAPERMKLTLYNAWLQNSRWKSELSDLARRFSGYPKVEG